MNYTYKRLGAEDVASLKQLRVVFAEAFAEQAHWNTNPPPDSYSVELLRDTNYIALVALNHDERVVGGLVAYVLPKIDQPYPELYLYDLAVDQAYRRQGIATQLIETLKGIGKELKATVIFVQADNVDHGAVALYEKLCDSKETDITHFDIQIQ